MNSKSVHLLWMQRDQWYRRYKIYKDSIKFWAFTVILTLKRTIYFLHKALQLMMMYHPIKFGCKEDQHFSRYGRNSHIWSNEPTLWPWTWRQQTNLLAWHFGPWCCITIHSLVTEGLEAEEISFRWTFTGILNLLTLTTTQQSNLFTRQFILWWCAIKPSLVAKGSAVQII